MSDFFAEFVSVVQAGGVLMAALAALAVSIYWLAIDTLSNSPKNLSAHQSNFDEELGVDLKASETQRLEFIRSRRNLLQVLTAAAPLLGLLGTVMGMLATFKGLTENNGDVFEQIAAGISEAMITTETGLVISIPALFLIMIIDSKVRGLEHCIEKSELSKGQSI